MPLAKPALPGSFDTSSAVALAQDLTTQYPDRAPGSIGAKGAADWFIDQLPPQLYGLKLTRSSWTQNVAGLGRVRLRNIAAVAPGQSPDVIVVMAHRDDVGTGPGANDNASGTAALIELARSFAQPETVGPRRLAANGRLPLDRRGDLRRARRGALPRDLSVPQATSPP